MEDKYRVEKELGRGGMSILYLVTSLESDEKVVLKQPKHDIPARHELYCESIRHEANILSRLDHPQIVKYVDFIHKYNILIMSYVEGKSLSELYDCKKATREDSLDIMRRLCDVVSYLHDQGIVHRDICPNNIILGPNKMPILLDFGTGYDMKQDNSVTKSVFHGSYSPPELARRDGAGDHGASIDVFSLGATLYYLLSNSSPPSLTSGTESLSLRGEDIFGNLIHGCTQRNPHLRFTVRDIRITLDGIEDIIRYKPFLKVIKSHDADLMDGTIFFLEKARNRIGKSPDNDVHIPAKFMTDKHTEIINIGGGANWLIKDCGSQNGTFRNSKKVEPNERVKLDHGDRIWLVYNPKGTKEPYIQMEFVSDKNRILECYREINDLDISTSWDWDHDTLKLRTTVKNNSRLPWKAIEVDYTGSLKMFTCPKSLELDFDLAPGQERYKERELELIEKGIGGDFTLPMKVRVGGRLVRDEDIYFRYGEGFQPSTGLEIQADRTLDGERINIMLRLKNTSPYIYNRVCVGLDMPDGLELLQPDARMRDIPYLGSNEEQAVTFTMKAKRSMRATIHFNITYHDHLGKMRHASAPEIDTGEIMPLIEPLEMMEGKFMDLIKSKSLAQSSRQTMYKAITIQKAKSRMSEACQNLYMVGQYGDENSFQFLYAGKSASKRSEFLLLCGAWKKEDDTIEFRFDGYCANPDHVESFLQEHFESVDRAIRLEKAMLVTEVTYNVDIKDSVIYKSNIGDGGSDINLTDGVAFNTNK